MDPKRLTAEDLGIIQTWYDRLEIQIQTHKIIATNIYNFNETRFQVGCGKDKAVIITHLEASRSIGSDSNRQSITNILFYCIYKYFGS